MRRSILTHQKSEEAIRSANSQLVTAMSHDLRTPLTSLMVYLELLDRGKVQDEEQCRHLIRQSLSQTVSIKAMADKLFEYFLVYTSEWEQPDMETTDADEIMRYFWQEYAFALESHGLFVETYFEKLHGSLMVNAELLRRVFDNLYVNIIKYADPSKPVVIRYCRKNNQLILFLENAVLPTRKRVESTNIGLNTCQRILKIHGGDFVVEETKDCFRIRIVLAFVGELANLQV